MLSLYIYASYPMLFDSLYYLSMPSDNLSDNGYLTIHMTTYDRHGKRYRDCKYRDRSQIVMWMVR